MQDALQASAPVSRGVKQHLKDLMSIHESWWNLKNCGSFSAHRAVWQSGKPAEVKKNNIKYKELAVKLEAFTKNNKKNWSSFNLSPTKIACVSSVCI